ncbi:MAG: glycoside hydrolase family 5 protein, partial [Treponema sp.]|nr:glycoside hydrolase family 5 protein [Treponema sp.]
YENTTPPNGGGTTPNAVSGNLGNYIFGTQADGVSVNIQHAVWNLSGVNLTNIKNADAQLVLGLSKAPNSSLQLVWQGPANNLWWNQNDILGGTGNVLNASHVTWNSGTNTLTINLAAALDNYSAFTAQPSLNLIIAYYGGSSVNDLGIVSANIVVSSGNGGQDGTPGTPSTPQPFNNITASQLVSNIRVGWNLGNSLDSANLFHKGSNLTVEQLEIGWDDLPIATKALIDAVKTAGFNAIRIPVTWSKAADSNYNIRADWMARITEVVNYAVDNDMYIILNTHHDDMDTSINNEVLFQFINAGINKSLIAFRKIWEQIADNFKNYNEKLIFEALNEPRTIDSPNEWTGGTTEERSNLNKHYEVFIDVVRKSGGNNDKRILMINTYAASSSQIALDGLVLPTDTIANKLIVSVHDYAPYNFALNSWNIGEQGTVDTWNPDNTADKLAITEPIDRLYEKFVSKGIPVIMGEFGSVNKNNLAARVVHAEFYISYAKSKGIRCFWWDNGLTVPRLGVEDGNFGIINRNNNQWTHPEIASALMRGADSAAPPNGGDITPNLIGGNLGNYIFGNNEGNIVYTQAVWNNLSNENLTLIKNPTVQLVLVLSQAPTSSLQLVWQGPANQLWWNQNDILGGIGNIVNAAYAIWNSGTNTLTINLAAALAEYSAFTTQPSLNLIIAYYGGSSVNDLGIVSANIVVP